MNRLTVCAGALAVLLLAACGATAGTGATGTGMATGTGVTTGTGATLVSGRLVLEGGPLRPGGRQPGERPIQGAVTFTAAGQQRITVRVGRSGTFSVALAPGTYHVSGRSPDVVEVSADGTRHETACSQPLVVRLAGQGMTASEILKFLAGYYSGFDRSKRARLDVKDFSPPLGKADAPVAAVEFSDFACPYCQALRPELERFVSQNEARVKLYYKPFPISSHPRAQEATVAAEWARDRGLFWKMHDQLFDHPHALADDDLAGYAAAIGGDADDLRKALEQGRNRARIAASQAEARGVGLVGTPTTYFNGRKLDLPRAPSEIADALRFNLEDEEEWSRHNGWTRD